MKRILGGEDATDDRVVAFLQKAAKEFAVAFGRRPVIHEGGDQGDVLQVVLLAANVWNGHCP